MRDLPSPVSVEVALKPSGISMSVPHGESLTIGPFESHHFESLRLARITAFDDLHRLGFVSKKISEQDAKSALFADHRAYREAAMQHRLDAPSPHTCSCDQRESAAPKPISRRMMQSNLIDVLQPLTSTFLDARNPLVLHTYNHLQRYFSLSTFNTSATATATTSNNLILVSALQDITIADHGILTMTPAVGAVYANNITIGNSGILRFMGGAVHVKCATLNGPNPFTQTTTTVSTLGTYVLGLSRENRRQH